MSQLAALQQLRAALDQALAHLAPLIPVLEVWTASQKPAPEPQERVPGPAEPAIPAEVPAAPDGPSPRPLGLFDPLPPRKPAPRRLRKAGVSGNRTSGSKPQKPPETGQPGATAPTSCERCGAPVEQQAKGARRKFCTAACRLMKAKAARMARREADSSLGSLPDRPERPFEAFERQDDYRSDPDLLRPPALAWELEERTAP
jgi:hypothetical protein